MDQIRLNPIIDNLFWDSGLVVDRIRFEGVNSHANWFYIWLRFWNEPNLTLLYLDVYATIKPYGRVYAIKRKDIYSSVRIAVNPAWLIATYPHFYGSVQNSPIWDVFRGMQNGGCNVGMEH